MALNETESGAQCRTILEIHWYDWIGRVLHTLKMQSTPIGEWEANPTAKKKGQ